MLFQFNNFTWSGAPPVLGIDIGAGGIRVIEFARKGKSTRIEHYSFQPLPNGAIRDGSVAQFDQIADGLRLAIKKSGSKTQSAALALPSSSVITKIITLPDFLSEDELELQVEAEASQNLPFAREEISLDFSVIGPSSSTPDSMELLLVAARKEKIDERLALAEAAGIKTVAMDIESFAAHAALFEVINREQQTAGHPTGLFQIGFENSSFSVLLNDILIYEREQSLGTQKLEQDLVRSNGNTQTMIVDAYHEMVAQELSRALQLFFTTTAHSSIGHIYLAGASAYLERLPTLLESRLDSTVSIAHPFSGMSLSSAVNQEAINADAANCLVAAGLAMRRFGS